MSEIHLCLAADQKFGKYLYFAVASILQNRAPEDILHFYILCNNVEDQDKARLQRLAEHYNLVGTLEFIEFDYSRFANLNSSNPRLPPAVYARLLIPEIFPDLEKILYLDCDIIVKSSLANLWETDLHGNPIAAAKDIPDEEMASYIESLGLNPDTYINAGILLLNCTVWRRDNLVAKALNAGKNLKLRYQDQDQLNIVFKDQITFLDRTWNSLNTKTRCPEDKIIHYAGHKPWETVFVSDSEHFWDLAFQLPDTAALVPDVKKQLKQKPFFHWYGAVLKCRLFVFLGYRREHYMQKLTRCRTACETAKQLKRYFTQQQSKYAI